MKELEMNLVEKKESCGKTREVYTIGSYEVIVVIFENCVNDIMVYAEDKRFVPSIYVCQSIFDDEIKGFEIQTTSYGALKSEEIKEVIKGYEEACEVVKVITERFVK